MLVSQKGHTKVIASHHDFSGSLDWSSSDTDQVYNKCASYGDVVLMAGISTNLDDASEIRQFRDRMNSLDGNKPLAAFNTGTSGKLSRILNPFLQATTHHLLPSSSAPDQLSLVESNGYDLNRFRWTNSKTCVQCSFSAWRARPRDCIFLSGATLGCFLDGQVLQRVEPPPSSGYHGPETGRIDTKPLERTRYC